MYMYLFLVTKWNVVMDIRTQVFKHPPTLNAFLIFVLFFSYFHTFLMALTIYTHVHVRTCSINAVLYSFLQISLYSCLMQKLSTNIVHSRVMQNAIHLLIHESF